MPEFCIYGICIAVFIAAVGGFIANRVMPGIFDNVFNVFKQLWGRIRGAERNAIIIVRGRKIAIIAGDQVRRRDIRGAVELDMYDGFTNIPGWDRSAIDKVTKKCCGWHNKNPYIYIMAKEVRTGRIIGYINMSPVTDEFYERILDGTTRDTDMDVDDLLSYVADLDQFFNLLLLSVVVQSEYRNTEVSVRLVSEAVKNIKSFGNKKIGGQEILVRRMVADAVSRKGKHICERSFGMHFVCQTNRPTEDSHADTQQMSSIYEVTLLPPDPVARRRASTSPAQQLYDYFAKKWENRNIRDLFAAAFPEDYQKYLDVNASENSVADSHQCTMPTAPLGTNSPR